MESDKNEAYYEEQQPYAYWLHRIKGIGKVQSERLLQAFGEPKAIYHATGKALQEVLPPKSAESVLQAQGRDVVMPYQKLRQKGISLIPMYHPTYPKRLQHLPDRPFCLYVKGNLPSDERMSLAIVGARNCSAYGSYVAESFAAAFAKRNVQIVSGLARGIDGLAGSAALAAGGDTYAVLGCGVDICYPAENRTLYQDICTGGGVISEYLPGTQPSPGLFPARNRIISALADAVLVVEARQKSGTLITVDMALEQGREVFVVPGRITDRLSDGCNRLLKQGAEPALTPEQVFEELSETVWKCRIKENGLRSASVCAPVCNQRTDRTDKPDGKERALLALLDIYPVSVEQIWLMTQTSKELQGTTLPRLMEMLVAMCVAGLLENEGGYYRVAMPGKKNL